MLLGLNSRTLWLPFFSFMSLNCWQCLDIKSIKYILLTIYNMFCILWAFCVLLRHTPSNLKLRVLSRPRFLFFFLMGNEMKMILNISYCKSNRLKIIMINNGAFKVLQFWSELRIRSWTNNDMLLHILLLSFQTRYKNF